MKKTILYFLAILFVYSLNAQTAIELPVVQESQKSSDRSKLERVTRLTSSNTVETHSLLESTNSKKALTPVKAIKNTLLDESFSSSTFPPTDWSRDGGSGTREWMHARDWSRYPDLGVNYMDGDYALFNAYLESSTAARSLITKKFTPSEEHCFLGFEVVEILVNSVNITSYGMQLLVDISINNGSTWITGKNILTEVPGHNTTGITKKPTLIISDLSKYIGQEIMVRFRAVSDYGGFALGLDNVRLLTKPDIKVTATPQPSVPLSHARYIFNASVRNEGNVLDTSLMFYYKVSPVGISEERMIKFPLNPGGSYEYVSNNVYRPTATGEYVAVASVPYNNNFTDRNIDTVKFEVTENTFKLDDGTIGGGLGASRSITFGNTYQLTRKDAIGSISTVFSTINASDYKKFLFEIYRFNKTSLATQLVYASDTFSQNGTMNPGELYEFEFEPCVLDAGDYIFAIKQLGNQNINCSYDQNEGQIYVVQNGTAAAQSGFGNLILRVHTTTAPAVVSYFPLKNSIDIDPSTNISVKFNQNIAAANLSGIEITEEDGTAIEYAAGSISGADLKITHTTLKYNTVYNVFIPKEAIANLNNDISWSFKTILDPDFCQKVINVQAGSINYNRATITWVDNGPATSWEVEYGTEGFALGSGTKSTVTTKSISLQGLTANTNYDIYVRGKCSENTYGEWSDITKFRTVSTPITIFPFKQGFNDSVRPSNWTGGNGWSYIAGSTLGFFAGKPFSGSRNAFTDYSEKLISPSLNLNDLKIPVLKFYYGLGGDEYGVDIPSEIIVSYRTSRESEWIILFQEQNVLEKWTEKIIELPDPSDDYAIAFEGFAYSLAGYVSSTGVVLDEVSVESIPDVDPGLKNFTNLENSYYEADRRPVTVILENKGADILTSASIRWTVNGRTQTAFQWTGSLDRDKSTEVTIGEYDFGLGTHTVVATVSVTGDAVLTNNRIETVVKVTTPTQLQLPYVEEFNGSLGSWESKSIIGGKNFEWTQYTGYLPLSSASKDNGYAVLLLLDGTYVGPDPASAALVSPLFDASALSGKIGLSFTCILRRHQTATTLKVQTSSDNFQNEINTLWSYTLAPTSTSDNVYGDIVIDASSLGGKEKLQFRILFEGGGAYGVAVDDFKIYRIEHANDLAITESDVAPFLSKAGEKVQFYAIIENKGYDKKENIQVSFNTGTTDLTGTINSLEFGKTSTQVMTWENAPAGIHDITISLPDDEDNTSNTKTIRKIVATQEQFTEGFEGDNVGWGFDDYWSIAQQSTFAYEGNIGIVAGGAQGDGAYNNVMLRTPFLNIQENDWIAFYGKYVNEPTGGVVPTVQLQYSSDGTNWTNIGDLISLTGSWTLYKVDLTGVSGVKYLAFKASGPKSSGSTYSCYTCIDHIIAPSMYTKSLTVNIKEDVTEEPIANVRVKYSGPIEGSATTDNLGQVVIPSLPVGQYNITISKANYATTDFLITFTNDDIVRNVTLPLSQTPLSPVRVAAEINGNSASLTWIAPGAAQTEEFRYDDGEVIGQLGLQNGTTKAIFGGAHKVFAEINEISWYLTKSGGITHNTVSVYLIALDANGMPTTSVLYAAHNVPNVDEQWNTHILTTPVETPHGFLVAVGYAGFASVGMTLGTANYPFVANTQFVTTDYSTGTYWAIEEIELNGTTGTQQNFTVRAKGLNYGSTQSLRTQSEREIAKRIVKSQMPELTYIANDEPVSTDAPIAFAKEPIAKAPVVNQYTVYRGLTGEDESNWTNLGTTTSTSFSDSTWYKVPFGMYQYAVKANYAHGAASPAALSNELASKMEVPYEVIVKTNSKIDDGVNAVVTLKGKDNTNTYTLSAESGRVIFPKVWRGIYDISVTKPGFTDYTDQNLYVPKEGLFYQLELAEIITAPRSLNVEQNGASADFTWNGAISEFFDDMEGHDDFIMENIGNYKLIDGDGNYTYGIQNYDYPYAGYPTSFLVFNPSRTTPALEGDMWSAHSGDKYLACFSSPDGANNDWLILPQIKAGKNMTFSFWAKSVDGQYPESFKAMISTRGSEPGEFVALSSATEVVPNDWTKYTYDLSQYNGQNIYLAINCISNNMFIMMLDDIAVSSNSSPSKKTNIAKAAASEGNPPLGYNIFLNYQLIESNYPSTEYTFDVLPAGAYTAGVQSVYGSGLSDIITYEFAMADGPIILEDFQINGGEAVTSSTTVSLKFNISGGIPSHYMVSEDEFFDGASWIAYTDAPRFTFDAKKGNIRLYAKLKNSETPQTAELFDDIYYKGLIKLSLDYFTMNNQAATTNSKVVSLNHSHSGEALWYSVSENQADLGQVWLPYNAEPTYELSEPNGKKGVYFMLANAEETSNVMYSEILLHETIESEGLEANVFPNPAHDYTHVEIEGFKDKAIVEIFTVTGELYYKGTYATSQFTINLNDYKPGVLLIKISCGDSYVIKRIVKR